MSQHQKSTLEQHSSRPSLPSFATDTSLSSSNNNIITQSTSSQNNVIPQQFQQTSHRSQSKITIHSHSNSPTSENSAPTTTIQTGDNDALLLGSSHILPIESSELIKHSDQIVGRSEVEERVTANIATDQVDNRSSVGKTNNWRFNDHQQQQFGEENKFKPELSFDRVIIESSTPQQNVSTSATNSDSSVVRAIEIDNNFASGRLGKTPAQLSDSPTEFGGGVATTAAVDLIHIIDKGFHSSSGQPTAQLAQKSASSQSSNTPTFHNNSADSKRLRFKSLLETVAASTLTPAPASVPAASNSSISTTIVTTCDSSLGELVNSQPPRSETIRINRELATGGFSTNRNQEEILLETLHEDSQEENYESDNDDDDDHVNDDEQQVRGQFESFRKLNGRKVAGSFRKSTTRFLGLGHAFIRLQRLLGLFNSKLIDTYKETPYVPYEGKDLLTGDSKYSTPGRKNKRHHQLSGGKSFRGSYRDSRTEISMAIFKKLINLLFQKSTLALIGAFLIHITLGTVYTLSNINSYLTSYMRLHGSPTLTYGGSMWISSFYAIGQGFSMVLGGYIEKRFSARLACFLGCFIHSGSIMSTSWAVDHGSLAVLLSYGFLPGFGCGLAYMTPMSNGFGWYPNRRGLVAGVILAGFGIGTFVFNIAQTAYVNPDNLSPPEDASGYFIQESILTKVPGLFLFIGSIYAVMQFVGCCLLFKPPYYSDQSSLGSKSSSPSDERPILETEMSVSQAVKTREFVVLFLVYGIITQGVLFVNSMIKEYGQIFIGDDMYLAWTGSMASIANALGRLFWGLAIDRYTFSQCFTCITSIFGLLMFLMPFEFVLSSKHLYLLCTLGIFGSFSGWMSTFPVHLSRTFGRLNSGMLYGLIFISQSFGGIASAFGAHYLIDHYTRFVPFFCVVFLEILGLAIYHLFYPTPRYL